MLASLDSKTELQDIETIVDGTENQILQLLQDYYEKEEQQPFSAQSRETNLNFHISHEEESTSESSGNSEEEVVPDSFGDRIRKFETEMCYFRAKLNLKMKRAIETMEWEYRSNDGSRTSGLYEGQAKKGVPDGVGRFTHKDWKVEG